MCIPSFGRRLGASMLILFLASQAFSQSPIPRGSILISHLSPDYGLSTDEFVVLYNAGPDTVNLAGYEVRYATASGSVGSAGTSFTGPTILPPARHFLIASKETIVVGSATAIRDAPMTTGLAASGGQLLLRSVSMPDSVVFAVAWGSVGSYLAGMSDAAPWSSDGMLSLEWNGSAYVRSAYNFSNLEYQHSTATTIAVIPSLHPIVPPSPWTISLVVRQGEAVDSSLLFGMSELATDSFDIGQDLPAPPPPIAGGLSVGIERPELNLATGEYLLRDLREVRTLADTSITWVVSVRPADPPGPVTIALVLRGLPASLPVRTLIETQGTTFVRSGDSVVCSFVAGSTERKRLMISIGDSTDPVVQFLEPAGPTTVVAGSSVRIRAIVRDGSGLDTVRLCFVDRRTGTAHAVPAAADSLKDFTWHLPERLLSDSTHFEIEAVDVIGHRRTAVSANVRLVPDTARRVLEAGWHLISSPLDPIDPRWTVTAGATPADSAFPFCYLHGAGYLPADSLVPRRGYFLGLLRTRMLTIVGLRPVDSVATALSPGFALIASSQMSPTPLSQLAFGRLGMERSYADAISAGWIGSGLYGFDGAAGGYYVSDTLRPWQGYWLPVLQEAVAFRVSTVGHRYSARTRDAESHGWRVRLVLSSGSQTDSLVSLGSSPRATDGFDAALDLPSPPPPPSGRAFTAWIEHPEWNLPTGPRFLSDIRSQREEHAWTVRVRSASPLPLTVMWRSEGPAPVGQLEFTPSSDGIARQLAEGDTAQLTLEGMASLLIRATVTRVPLPPEVPVDFQLTPGYPNPFNATTHFAVTVPRPGHLAVSVFDLLGRQVARLTEGPVAAGTMPVEWTPELTTGVYIVRAVWTLNNGRSTVRSQRVMLLR